MESLSESGSGLLNQERIQDHVAIFPLDESQVECGVLLATTPGQLPSYTEDNVTGNTQAATMPQVRMSPFVQFSRHTQAVPGFTYECRGFTPILQAADRIHQ